MAKRNIDNLNLNDILEIFNILKLEYDENDTLPVFKGILKKKMEEQGFDNGVHPVMMHDKTYHRLYMSVL